MHCREEETSVFWIETDEELTQAVASWDDCVGLDTEFIRTDTFYPIPGLYQIASGSQIFLLNILMLHPFHDARLKHNSKNQRGN